MWSVLRCFVFCCCALFLFFLASLVTIFDCQFILTIAWKQLSHCLWQQFNIPFLFKTPTKKRVTKEKQTVKDRLLTPTKYRSGPTEKMVQIRGSNKSFDPIQQCYRMLYNDDITHYSEAFVNFLCFTRGWFCNLSEIYSISFDWGRQLCLDIRRRKNWPRQPSYQTRI